MSNNTDEDELSAFVRDIDTRVPLGGRDSPGPPYSHSPSPSPSSASPLGPRPLAREPSAASNVTATVDTMDARLRSMCNTFYDTLERFERPRTREASAASGSGSGSTDSTARQSVRTVTAPTRLRRESPLASPAFSRVGARDAEEEGEGGERDAEVGLGIAGVPLPLPLPRAYARPRLGSTGSARSGFSVASEEVIGRMDPELDERREGRRPGA